MKKLQTYHVFLAEYFFWAGALICVISAMLPNGGTMTALGCLMAMAGSVVDFTAFLQERRMRERSTPYTPSSVQIVSPSPSAIHIRGIFFFTLECTYEDGAAVHTVQSPLMSLPKWSRYLRNGTLTTIPNVTIFVKGTKVLLSAYLPRLS